MGLLKSKLYRGEPHLRKIDSTMTTKSDNVDCSSTLCEYHAALMEELRLIQSPHPRDFEGLQHSRGLRLDLESRLEAMEERIGTRFRSNFSTFSPWKFDVAMPLKELGIAIDDRRRSIAIATSIQRLQLPIAEGRVFSPILIETPDSSPTDALRLLLATSADARDAIEMSSQFGRIIGFDFNTHPPFSSDEMSRLPVWLLIYHTCCMYAGTIVCGIPFVELNLEEVRSGSSYATPFKRLNEWLSQWHDSETYQMMREFDRLTKASFKIARSTTVVFILHGMANSPGGGFHLLRELGTCPRAPLCVLTGTHMARLASRLVARVRASQTLVASHDVQEGLLSRRIVHRIIRKCLQENSRPRTAR